MKKVRDYKHLFKWFPWAVTLLTGILAIFASLTNIFPLKFTTTQIGGGYFTIPGINILSGDQNFKNLLLITIYCCMAAAVGAAVQLKFFPRLIANWHYRLFIPLTGFFSGYLVFVSVNRLFSLIFDKQFALLMIVITTVSITVLSIVYLVKVKIWKNKIEAFKSSTFSLCIVFCSLIFGIQSQQSKVIGDAAAITINTLFNISSAPENSLPTIGQHYDETSFLFPIYLLTEGSQPGVLAWFLFTYSFGRAASLTIIYLSIASMSKNHLFSALFATCVFFTSFSPSPIGLPLLFDAGPSLALNLHIGRILIITLAISVFSQLAICRNIVPKISLINSIVLIFVGIGLSSISPHMLWVIVGVLIYIAYRSKLVDHNAQNLLLLFLPVVLIFTVPEPDSTKLILLAVYLIVGFVFILISIIKKIKSTPREESLRNAKSRIAPYSFIFFGTLFGYAFLGNSFTAKVYSILGIEKEVLKPRDVKADLNGFGINPFVFDFPFEHQQNVLYFMYFFGSVVFLIAFSAAISFNGIKKLQNPSIIEAIFVTSFMLGLSFFIWDYMNTGEVGLDPWLSIWVKSRLIEPYFYVAICLTSVVIFKFAEIKTTKFTFNIATVGLVAYLFLALALPLPGGMLGQFLYNFSQVISYISHLLV